MPSRAGHGSAPSCHEDGAQAHEAGAGDLQMNGILLPIVAMAGVFLAAQSCACSIVADPRTNAQIKLDSAPLSVTASCGFQNGGVYDNLSAGNAEDLENGRVLQRVNETDHSVLLADCGTREVTMLHGPFAYDEDSLCGPMSFFDPLVGDNAIMSMSAGATLRELVDLAVQHGATEQNPIEVFNTDPWGDPVDPKDRVDLLCGCQLYYPDSPGANP
jgi:hypothetical protein